MPKTKYLNEAEKKAGQNAMYIEETINGVSYSLLADTIVYLLALSFGASSLALGYIASASYIAGVVLPFVPRLFQGKNQVKVQSAVWYLRGFVCLGYLGLFFLEGSAAVLLLLGIYTAFCIFRMVGVALNDFTLKSISSVSNRGKVVANVNVAYQSSSMIVRCLMALVLGFQQFSGLFGMLMLQMIGVVGNTLASRKIRHIPCRSVVTYKKGRNVWVLFREAMQQHMLSRRLLLRWISTCVAVIFGMTVPFLRVELHLSGSMVVLYSVALGLSAVFASFFSKQFADRLGSRPLVVLSSLFTLFFLVIWVLLPASTPPIWFFILGFFTNFFISMVSILVVRLVAQVMPDEEAISFNSMVNFVIAIIAFAVGLVSGMLAAQGELARNLFTLEGQVAGNGYSLVFIFALGLTAVETLVATRLQEVGSYSSQAAAAVIFSVHGLQAVSMLEKLDRTTNPAKRRALMLALGNNLNNIATSEMRGILASPFSTDKKEVLRALADRPRPALFDVLIRIAQDNDSYVQLDAIAVLGSYGKEPRAKEVLAQLLLEGRWSSVRSMASKSLARITESTEYLSIVNELSLQARHIDEEIDFLLAKRFMDKQGLFYQDFFLSVEQRRSATFRQTRYAVLASFLKFGSPRLSNLYELMNNGDVKDFLSGFLTEARDLPQIDECYDEILVAFETENWGYVRDFCMGVLDICDVSQNPCFENLRLGILKGREMDLALFDIQDFLSELYFSYSLGKNSRS
ncbi:MFS transporter [uncultured Sphaerochaeta sp.]|uniref:MFS transporter n=1 Tax=uncultured Sphaerochaeta sp. TaxID=886478 RepID=UPI002A0A3735|nr:MFS transporter [uncultured Sphaerochaeta sp.]